MVEKKDIKAIMFSLGADLCGVASVDRFDGVCDNCNLCVEICPVNALSEEQLRQLDCWNHAFGDDKELNTWKISCHKCRDICPYNFGSKNSF